MVKIINQSFLCLLILHSIIHQKQAYAQVTFDDFKIEIDEKESDEAVFKALQEIRLYYKNNQFEQGLKIVNDIFDEYFNQCSIQSKELILNFAIKLSFALDLRDSTLNFMDAYYKINPSFSDRTIPDITPPLQAFIIKYVKSKNQVSVFVNKFAQNIDFISSTISIYDQSDFDRLGVRNLLDLIRITPGFAEMGDWNERQFGTRGTSNTTLQDVLILINGHRISDNLTSSNGPDWISLDYVKQIELVRGPGSAIYGGNAFSGAINIVTKSGIGVKINEANLRLGNGNDFSSIGQRLDNAYKFNYQYGTQINNTESIYLSATFHQSGGSEIDYSDADRKIILSENSQDFLTNGSATYDYFLIRAEDTTGVEHINAYGPSYNFLLNYINNSIKLTANAQSSNYYLPRSLRKNLWASHDVDSLNSLRRRIDRREFIQIQGNFLEKTRYEKSALELKISGDHFFKDLSIPLWSIGDLSNSSLTGNEYRASVNLEFSTQALTLGIKKLPNFLLIGAEWYVNHWNYHYLDKIDDFQYTSSLIDDASYSTILGGSSGDRNENFAAFYIQDEMHLIKDKMVLNVSVRFNYDEVYSNFKNGIRWGEQYSPRLSLVYIASNNEVKKRMLKFKAIYNSAFLPAAFLYRKGFVPAFRTPINGTAPLDAQIIESIETGTFLKVNEHLDFSFQTYINYIRGNIVQNANSKYVNDALPTRIAGHEMEFKYRHITSRSYINGINYHIFGNYSYSRTQIAVDSLAVISDIFNENLWSDTTTRYPTHYFNFGGDISFKKSVMNKTSDQYSITRDYDTKFHILFGINGQFITQSHRFSAYNITNKGLPEDIETGKEWIEIPKLFLLNANANAYFGRYKLGINIYNLLNKEGFITSSDTNLGLQRQEGRMFYLSLGYLF